ncbi:MAG: hypothetical protein HQK90_14255 [Nitrospirae bacterium]|nr:hypothetical protein [Nitrospirota bacterium]
MVANSGFFKFLTFENDRKDLVGFETIQTFRLEKLAESSELIVLPDLFRGLEYYLNDFKFLHKKEQDKALKGFEAFGDITIIYRITPPQKNEDTGKTFPDHYKSKRTELHNDSKLIPIFGKLYPPRSMEESFVNLSLDKDKLTGSERFRKHVYDDRCEICGPMFEIDKRKRIEDQRDYSKDITAERFFEKFSKAFIFGLPGAGKTTILRHVAYQVLNNDQNADILFVQCKFIRVENLKKFGLEASDSPSTKDIFKTLAITFLFNGELHNNLMADRMDTLDDTVSALEKSWENKKLIVLVDALDECQSVEIRNIVVSSCLSIMGGISDSDRAGSMNTVYVTSRIALVREINVSNEIVFYVNPITMEDMRSMAKRFWGEGELYSRFDNIIWREPVAKKLGGTPLMAMLLLFYFETFGSFKLRYNTYDLILKFIHLKIWELLKKQQSIGRGDVHDLCKDSEAADFLDKYPEIKDSYNALSKLGFNLLYKSKSGETEWDVTEETLKTHFTIYLKTHRPQKENETEDEFNERITKQVNDWLKFFKDEHILISAGYDKYVFMHSTILEFLAARHFLKSGDMATMLPSMVLQNKESLEALPIASGFSYKTGAEILKLMEPFFDKEDRFSTLPFRCLSETESAEFKILEPQVITETYEYELKKINREKNKKDWVYLLLKTLVMNKEVKELKAMEEPLKSLNPLCRDTFVTDYLPTDWEKYVKDLNVRKDFLGKIWKPNVPKKRSFAAIEITAIAADNFAELYGYNHIYYADHVRYFKDFLGSPNLKHSDGVTCLAVSPDGKYIISGSDDHTLRLWDIETGNEIRSFEGHKNWVIACNFSPDGK